MSTIDRVNSAPNTVPANSIDPIPLPHSRDAFVSVTDQISSLDPDLQREITGRELFVKSAAALTAGVIPFIGSKIGEFVVKGCAYLTTGLRTHIHKLGVLGLLLEFPLRMFIGIPAMIGGVFLLGGAFVFSKSQALVWGQGLVEHPQEEKANTKLARYGAGEKPFQDLKKLGITYFLPPKDLNYKAPDDLNSREVTQCLTDWQSFEAT